jgi:hypothetical protein
MKKFFRLMRHPTPELIRLDTSLRYTDILFGFVIREIFLRLQYWQNLDRYAWMHLSTCLALVLGSWIGYRRSLNRTSYEVKFFNLPFFRFLLDQAMLILYFQIVGSTPVDLGKPTTVSATSVSLAPDPSTLANITVKLLFFIFLLYWLWDILGIRMAVSNVSGKPRYPDVRDNVKDNSIVDETRYQKPDWTGFGITSGCFGLIAVLFFLSSKGPTSCLMPTTLFIVVILLLLAYRVGKEIRTSWRLG